MFTLRYLLSGISRRPLYWITGLLLVALSVCAFVVLAAAIEAEADAETAAMESLERLGTDLIVVCDPETADIRMVSEYPEGTHAVEGSVYTLASVDDGDYTGRDFVNISLPTDICGDFNASEVESLAATPGVASISGALLASYNLINERIEKVEVAGVAPSLQSLSRQDEAALEAAVQADPEYKALVDEMNILFAKPEPELTARDQAQLEELSDLLGKRRGEVYHEKRPDVFAEPLTREEQTVTPKQPEIISDTFLFAGVLADNPYVCAEDILEGRYYEESDMSTDVAMVQSQFARARHLSVGSEISVPGKVFKIIAIVESPLGASAPDVFVPLPVLQKHLSAEGKLSILFVKSDSTSSMAALRTKLLSYTGLKVSDISEVAEKIPVSVSQSTKLIMTYGRVLTILLVGSTALLLGFLGLRTIDRKTREIATLKAVGWPTRKVALLCIGETLSITVLGLLVGLAFSIPVLKALSATTTVPLTDQLGSSSALLASLAGWDASDVIQPVVLALPASLGPIPVLAALGATVAVSVVASGLVLWRFSRMKPAALLKRL